MLPARARDWPSALLWLALLAPATLIGGYALRYVNFDPTPLPYELRVNMQHAPIPFVLHTTFGGLALLLGPLQFVTRRRYPQAHRWMGRLYILCCLISGLAAYPVALGTLAGPVAAAGFASMATAWLATTLVAFAAIRRGRVALHRRWMVLSFALTLSAVTLRVSCWCRSPSGSTSCRSIGSGMDELDRQLAARAPLALLARGLAGAAGAASALARRH